MKLTKKQIEMIIKNTPAELKGKYERGNGGELGYYMPSNANWSYHAVFMDDGRLVVTQFGFIM